MKTLRAFLRGYALGALVGLFLALRHNTIAGAQHADERARDAEATGPRATSRSAPPEEAETAGYRAMHY